MRTVLGILAAPALLCGLTFFAAGYPADPPAPEGAPWAGTYLKYARYDTARRGQFGEAQQVTITKVDGGYYLSRPYDGRKFTEVAKGVLSDGKGGLGKLYLGSAVFADGKRVRVLRAEFCYEQFILYGGFDEPARKAASPAK